MSFYSSSSFSTESNEDELKGIQYVNTKDLVTDIKLRSSKNVIEELRNVRKVIRLIKKTRKIPPIEIN